MAPTPASAKTKNKGKEKKEKLFHPQSRKAAQLERKQLRQAKLTAQASKKSKKESAKIDRFVFFYHAIPPDALAITLEELHTIVQDIWLKRHDVELEAQKANRRKDRPKSARQMHLEEIVLREKEEYRTGLEVPDITHPPTVKVFREWGQTGVGYLDLLRYIRINSEDLTSAVVSKPGRHESITQIQDVKMEDAHKETGSPHAVLFGTPTPTFASSIQPMDDGPSVFQSA